jgi:hypothetical protein
MQGFNFALAAKQAAAQDLLGGPHDRRYLAIYPSFFIIGTPVQHFSHKVYPLSATKSRGVFRVYWVGEDDTPSKRYAREYALATIRDIHTEDVNIINRAQKGLLSGAIKNIHFMSMEGLCRHLIQNVVASVEEWQARGEAA